MALKDDHVEVRQWLARHSPLSDTAREQLLKDPDPFVRACVWENPGCLPYKNLAVDWATAFEGCTHLERLALMRNPKVPKDLIERVFDPADTELAIDLADRHQLALAALTNETFFQNMKRAAALGKNPLPSDGWTWYSADKFLKNIWEFASAWPEGAAIRHVTYRQVPAQDEIKASWYKKSSTGLRGPILENCGPGDRMTLELAMNDSDELRRSQAYGTVGYLTKDELNTLVTAGDYMALDAACCNRSLPAKDRQKILKRLRELGHNDEPWLDAAKKEVDAAIKRKEAESESDEIAQVQQKLPAFQEVDDDDEINGIGRDAVIDNSVIASRIALLAQRQRRYERRLERGLTKVTAALEEIWAYAAGTSDLLLTLLSFTLVIWLLFALLPGWVAAIGFVVTLGIAAYTWEKKMAKNREQARQFFRQRD